MDAQTKSGLVDTQNLPDDREIAIDRVGVTNVRFPIIVRDKSHQSQNTVALVSLTVDLPHHHKGTHMSRFIEVLNEHGSVVHVENIEMILRHLQKRLHSRQAHVSFEFPYFIEKAAPVTGAIGLMDYTVKFTATANHDDIDFVVTVIVPVTTLCPCSKAISAHGAHNQRGQVTLNVRCRRFICCMRTSAGRSAEFDSLSLRFAERRLIRSLVRLRYSQSCSEPLYSRSL